jgi:hypothetical protein
VRHLLSHHLRLANQRNHRDGSNPAADPVPDRRASSERPCCARTASSSCSRRERATTEPGLPGVGESSRSPGTSYEKHVREEILSPLGNDPRVPLPGSRGRRRRPPASNPLWKPLTSALEEHVARGIVPTPARDVRPPSTPSTSRAGLCGRGGEPWRSCPFRPAPPERGQARLHPLAVRRIGGQMPAVTPREQTDFGWGGFARHGG